MGWAYLESVGVIGFVILTVTGSATRGSISFRLLMNLITQNEY